ncbi:MAG: NTP transferase domain-containing protein [Chloroflexi bacterium]|nr:NTP transferase domain-containing protein [Chloroflexota bacterium]
MSLAVLLLAAGKGTRMLSKRQKILHEVGGKPMVQHVFETAVSVTSISPIIVVGPGETGVQALFATEAEYVLQPQALGTGHATSVAADALRGRAAQVLVTYGDMPLLLPDTVRKLAQAQADAGAALSLLSVMGESSSTFGRVVRDQNGNVREIVEVAEAKRRSNTDELINIRELNAGVYCFDADWLWAHIDALPVRQARNGQEYYLTDMIEIAVQQGRPVVALATDDADECLGAGTRQELVTVEKAFRRRANRKWLNNGVTLIDPDSTFIDPDVTIGQDSVIWPHSYLQGNTVIGEDCVIGPNAIVRNAQVGNDCRIEQAVVEGCVVLNGTAVLPFTHLTHKR